MFLVKAIKAEGGVTCLT